MIENNTQPVYAWYGSPLHLPLSEKAAVAYNRRVAQFFEAQENFLATNGRRWDGREPILMEVDKEAQDVYDKVGTIVNLCVELCGGGIAFSEEEMEFEPGFMRIN